MDMRAQAPVYLALAVLVAACGGIAGASPTPAPSPLPMAELKYRVMDAGGRISFCDPDFYPVARADEEQLAKAKIGQIQADAETYGAITKRVGTDTLSVYREWKALNALQLTPLARIDGPPGPMTWSFAYRSSGQSAGPSPTPKQGPFFQVEGIVNVFGKVDITKNANAGGAVPCPICLALGTRIATPHGDVAVEALRIGDIVWTQDGAGARVAAPLVAIGSTPVSAAHEVVRLVLADGRTVVVSPGHPTADERRVGELRPGDVIDGSVVLSAERIAYGAGFTFDILPAGASGAYWANGVLLGSTLR
jgi:hypothetical protein